jgi:hypothetical protein
MSDAWVLPNPSTASHDRQSRADRLAFEAPDHAPESIRHNVLRVCAMIRPAKDLSPDQKVAIESLLGRRVLEDEEISVRAIQPPSLSDERRKELVEQLRTYFEEVDSRRKPASAEEAEDTLTEAIRSVRPGFRPHQ